MLKATLEQWRMFKAVVDAGGFNQAAQQVHKSQSSIHHAVQKLEQGLGITLFVSDGRKVKLTESGELMLRRANLLLDDLKSHRQIVVRDSSSKRKVDAGWLSAEKSWTVSHLRTSIDILCQGMGFAWLPVAFIREQLDQGLLKPLPLNTHGVRKAMLYLLFDDGDRLGPAARTFIGELRHQTMHLPSANGFTLDPLL